MKMNGQSARVFLLDDHPAMRSGLSQLLRHVGLTVCGEAGSRAELLLSLKPSETDIVLLDLSLAEESGLDVLDEIQVQGLPVLAYSMHEDSASIESAFERGANGYVTKREGVDVLLEAIAQVVDGKRYISPRSAHGLASRVLDDETPPETALSSREEQIMDKLGRGETSAEIAQSLNISTHTVQTYYVRIIEKLNLSGMKELRKLAIRKQKQP